MGCAHYDAKQKNQRTNTYIFKEHYTELVATNKINKFLASKFKSASYQRCCTSQGSPYFLSFLTLALDGFGQLDQPLGGVGMPIEQHVFNTRQQILGNLFVNGELTCVDDPHVEPGANRMI